MIIRCGVLSGAPSCLGSWGSLPLRYQFKVVRGAIVFVNPSGG